MNSFCQTFRGLILAGFRNYLAFRGFTRTVWYLFLMSWSDRSPCVNVIVEWEYWKSSGQTLEDDSSFWQPNRTKDGTTIFGNECTTILQGVIDSRISILCVGSRRGKFWARLDQCRGNGNQRYSDHRSRRQKRGIVSGIVQILAAVDNGSKPIVAFPGCLRYAAAPFSF